jgi:hypothetical protein
LTVTANANGGPSGGIMHGGPTVAERLADVAGGVCNPVMQADAQ